MSAVVTDIVRDIAGVRVLICSQEGPPLAHERDTNTFISAAWDHNAELVALPLARLGEDFLQLKTRLAGEAIQKFVNYQLRLAILGDISAAVAQSKALHDFIYEANRGQDVWFVRDLDELQQRLVPEVR
jgi:hypothetical protein